MPTQFQPCIDHSVPRLTKQETPREQNNGATNDFALRHRTAKSSSAFAMSPATWARQGGGEPRNLQSAVSPRRRMTINKRTRQPPRARRPPVRINAIASCASSIVIARARPLPRCNDLNNGARVILPRIGSFEPKRPRGRSNFRLTRIHSLVPAQVALAKSGDTVRRHSQRRAAELISAHVETRTNGLAHVWPIRGAAPAPMR